MASSAEAGRLGRARRPSEGDNPGAEARLREGPLKHPERSGMPAVSQPIPSGRLEPPAAGGGLLAPSRRCSACRETTDRVAADLERVAEGKAGGEDDRIDEPARLERLGHVLRVVAAMVADDAVVRAETVPVRGRADENPAPSRTRRRHSVSALTSSSRCSSTSKLQTRSNVASGGERRDVSEDDLPRPTARRRAGGTVERLRVGLDCRVVVPDASRTPTAPSPAPTSRTDVTFPPSMRSSRCTRSKRSQALSGSGGRAHAATDATRA